MLISSVLWSLPAGLARTPAAFLVSSAAESTGGFLSELAGSDQISRKFGFILWLIALIVVLIVLLVLLLGRRGHDNQMSSGRVYSRRREVRARRKRLLNEKYYYKPKNRKKY